MRTHMRNLSFYMHIYAEIRISDHLKFNIFVETQWLLYLLNSKCITHQKNPVFWNKWPSNADNAIGRKDLSCLQTCGVRDEVGYKKNCYAPMNDPIFHLHWAPIFFTFGKTRWCDVSEEGREYVSWKMLLLHLLTLKWLITIPKDMAIWGRKSGKRSDGSLYRGWFAPKISFT